VLRERPDNEGAREGLAEVDVAAGAAEATLGAVPETPDGRLLAALAHHALGDSGAARRLLFGTDGQPESASALPHRRAAHASLARALAAPEDPDFVFVGGAGRSGTTLLRAMLHAHPRLHAGPEAKLIQLLAEFRETWGGQRPCVPPPLGLGSRSPPVIVGQVLVADDDGPVAGATVSAEPMASCRDPVLPGLPDDGLIAVDVSGPDGSFQLDRLSRLKPYLETPLVSDRCYSLRARAPGFCDGYSVVRLKRGGARVRLRMTRRPNVGCPEDHLDRGSERFGLR
jgi:hypothetical protein